MGRAKKPPKANVYKYGKLKPKIIPEHRQELEEIQQLRALLKLKKKELYLLQRERAKVGNREMRQKSSVSSTARDELFVRPQKIVTKNSITNLKRNLELLAMITGMEVQSYVKDKHCAIVFHMQHDSKQKLTHGLKINMTSGANVVSESSLPAGFNLNAVLDDFDNIMLPECLGAIRNALVAYYDRLEQYDALKKLLNTDGQIYKNMDGTHMEVTFNARSELEAPAAETPVVIILDYRVYDIRPKQYTVVEIDIPEESVTALKSQLGAFKKKCLTEAFQDAFMDGIGPYLIIKQFGLEAEAQQPRRKKRKHQNPYNRYDDTFRPEDCSQTEEEQDE